MRIATKVSYDEEIAEAMAEANEQIWRNLIEYKEKIGTLALKRLSVEIKDMAEMEIGGDESQLIIEENGFESAQTETNEIAEAIEEKNELVADKTNIIEGVAKANEETNEVEAEETEEKNDVVAKKANEVVAKANVETNEVKAMEETNDVVAEKANEVVAKANEETNEVEARVYVVKVNALDAKLGVLHDECDKSSLEWCIHMMGIRYALSKDCELLLDEYAKSAAELCIKKMRFGAFVNKFDKREILEREIAEATRMKKELVERLMAFKRKLTVGGSVMDDKCALCDEKVVVRNINELEIPSSFASESLRVLQEMVNMDQEVDEARALTDKWFRDAYWKCILTVCVGVLVYKHTIFEVLKCEVAETWKMEKEVKDKLVICQQKHAQAQAHEEMEHLIHRLKLFCEEVCLWALCAVISIAFGAIVLGWRYDVDGFGLVWRNLGRFVVGIIAFSIALGWMSQGQVHEKVN